jgi:hypothetical protein
MRSIICISAALAICAGSTTAVARHATPASMSIKHNSWTYTYKGTRSRESVDNDGNYITQSSRGKHLDHGTAVMKGDKVCFTSAMDAKRDGCWTAKDLKVGQSAMTTSDKGEKLKVTRIKYAPLSMPK